MIWYFCGLSEGVRLIGTKEIHAVNLVRIGIGKVKTAGFIGRAKFKVNWELYKLHELKGTYDKVMSLLQQKPIGEFLAMEAIFGRDVAIRAAKREDVIAPPLAGITHKRNGSTQNMGEESMGEEDFGDDPIDD